MDDGEFYCPTGGRDSRSNRNRDLRRRRARSAGVEVFRMPAAMSPICVHHCDRLRPQTGLAHQASNPFPAVPLVMPAQIGMDAGRAPQGLVRTGMDGPDALQQGRVGCSMGEWWPLQRAVAVNASIAAFGARRSLPDARRRSPHSGESGRSVWAAGLPLMPQSGHWLSVGRG
jgi:hypothetical protein